MHSPTPSSADGRPEPLPERLRKRLFARYVGYAARHPGRLLLALGALALLCLVPILRLELHTDMAELLPDQHPAVMALRRIAGRQKGSTNLILLIESPDEASNRRFVSALRPALEALVPEVFQEIQSRHDPEIPEFAERWRWLYADLEDLLRVERLLERMVARHASPLLVDLEEDDPEAELRAMHKRLEDRAPKRHGGSSDFVGQEGDSRFLGLMLWKRGTGLASLDDHATLARVEALVHQVGPARFHPAMRVRYTGHIVVAIAEHNAIRDDLTLATVLCFSLVFLSIWLYFRRVAVLWVIGAPAVLGLLLALALGQLSVRHLNANTAFLISIILGNGINSPIILLARYGEERRRGLAVPAALERAMNETFLATGAAMAAASIAYGSLLLTSFRGFSQFGLVGGAGMLLVWLVTFLLVPPMVLQGERLRPGVLTPRENLVRRPFAWLARLGERRPLAVALGLSALLLGAAVPLARFLGDPIEWNFARLRSKETQAQRDWGLMYRLGMGDVGAGYIGTDGVLLVDRADQADAVAEALRQKDARKGEAHILKEVRTLNSVLPRQQEEKLAVLGRVRALIDRQRDRLSAEDWREVEKFRPPDGLRAIDADDLPLRVRESFTEVGGERGRLVGIDADPARFSDWNGHDLLRLADALRVEALGQTWVAASTSTVFAGMLESILRDGPRVTLAAFLGVLGLVLLAFGVRGALPVIAALLVGVVWLGGLMALLGLKLNFINFIAIPITLGIGADYAANIWARLRHEGTARLVDVVADTGSAVALCSLTTIIGYSSLLLASNRALQSFGLVADLGEVTCLLAALVALPALVRLGRRG